MTLKTAYLWGPISSFSGPLAALLLRKGWQVHVATKSALNLFALAPLDLRSQAQTLLERALGGHSELHIFQERVRFLDQGEIAKSTNYDALIFCGLPPNYDEQRAPRAPWAAGELAGIGKQFKNVPTFILSSLWAGIQADGVVPEEFEFERRKPLSHWEGVCQQYEHRLLQSIAALEAPWHLIRLPLISGSTADGSVLNFSGISALLKELSAPPENLEQTGKLLKLDYNPDSTLWFLPVNVVVQLFWRLLEDVSRPRICNLVSTQNILNREWVQHLAQALGYAEVEVSEEDSWSLPGILRRALKDAIHVKTRNLFEVAGRYQYTPTRLDAGYFEKLIAFGKSENWGKVMPPSEPEQIAYSEDLARNYFQEFMPSKISPDLLKEATKGGATVGFVIGSDHPLSFVLKAPNGTAHIEPLDPNGDRPRISFRFSGETMARLVQNKVSLPKALLNGEVRMEGPILEGLRISNALTRFLQGNPYTAAESEAALTSADKPP